MTLHKTIKKKWFDMIVSGEKKHEYLEIKPYWINRLLWHEFHEEVKCIASLEDAIYSLDESDSIYKMDSVFRNFDDVTCRNGYNPKSPLVIWEHKGISIGEGNPEWGAEQGVEYFILHIGKIISVS